MIGRLVAILLVGLFGSTTVAMATESLSCTAVEGGTAIEVNLGHAAVESPSWVRVSVGDESWSSLPDDVAAGATAVAVAQSFGDATGFSLDIADANLEAVKASLRLLRVSEGDDYIEAGYLAFPGRGAFAVTCTQ